MTGTDPTPLLLSSEPDSPPPSLHDDKHQQQPYPSLDHLIEHLIGDFGWSQLLQALLVSFAWFFDAQQTFISVFADADPKWTCNHNSTSCNITNSNICQLPSNAWSWDLPAETSTISEWSLQCSGSIITGLPASSFFLGCLIGGFSLSTLGDSSLGRKNLLVLSSIVMSLSGVLTAFSTSVWIYAGLRLISGFGRAAIGTCALVLSTELVCKKWREIVGIAGCMFFTAGFLSLPGVAFFLKGSSWRLIYLWTCIPSVFYSLFMYFFVLESPRWLFVKGRKEEFAKTLRSIASPAIDRSTITESFLNTDQWGEKSPVDQDSGDIFSALKVLMKKGWAKRRLAAVMVVGFGVGTVYFGMPFGFGNLSLDLYLSVTLNGLSEFPASPFAIFLIRKLDRKKTVMGLAVLSGTCIIACGLMGRWNMMQIGLELMSFFIAGTIFDVVLVYSMELFPTCVRNSALAMVRQGMVFGAVLGPVAVAAGRKKGLVLSYGVFGATILVCGLFVLCLPETRGRMFCDTMEEEERKVLAVGDGVYSA